MPAAVTYTFTNTEVADAAKFNQNYSDLVDAINDFDGGTASNTQRLALPKAGTSTLNGLTRKEALIFYDTTEKKLKFDDGTNLKAVGGGLVPVPTDESHSTDLESGKHYMVDCTGASADVTLNLQAGATEADIKLTVYNIPSGYKVIVTPDGTEKIFYDDTDCDTVTFEYAETEQWIELCWNGTKWIVNDGSGVLSGTFNGSLDFTGGISFNGGDQLNYYEEYSDTLQFSFAGGSSPTAPTILITLIGNACTITVPATTTTSNLATGIFTSAALPARFRPNQDVSFLCATRSSSTTAIGRAVLQSDGTFIIIRDGLNASFTDGDSTGHFGFCGSYVVA